MSTRCHKDTTVGAVLGKPCAMCWEKSHPIPGTGKTSTTQWLCMTQERRSTSQVGNTSLVYSSLWLESYQGSTLHCFTFSQVLITLGRMHNYRLLIQLCFFVHKRLWKEQNIFNPVHTNSSRTQRSWRKHSMPHPAVSSSYTVSAKSLRSLTFSLVWL